MSIKEGQDPLIGERHLFKRFFENGCNIIGLGNGDW